MFFFILSLAVFFGNELKGSDIKDGCCKRSEEHFGHLFELISAFTDIYYLIFIDDMSTKSHVLS